MFRGRRRGGLQTGQKKKDKKKGKLVEEPHTTAGTTGGTREGNMASGNGGESALVLANLWTLGVQERWLRTDSQASDPEGAKGKRNVAVGGSGHLGCFLLR